jgi:hypothetical protein
VRDLSKRSEWDDLVFGSYSRDQVQKAVDWPAWQGVRLALLGQPLAFKHAHLHSFLCSAEAQNARTRARICVTNYIHALSRGGLLK